MTVELSIIIPVYNSEKYLAFCLKSIFNQTFQNFEVIVINDGSKDSSIDIINEFKSKYDNLILIEQKNSGVSVARNKAIDMASGKYLMFLDSDDAINSFMIESLFQLMQNNNVELVVSNLINFEHEMDIDVKENKINNEVRILTHNEAMNLFYLNRGISAYVCGKLFVTDIIKKNKIKFPVNMLYEDTQFTYEYLFYCKKIIKINANYYYYRNNPASITHTISPKAIVDFNKATQNIEDICARYNGITDNFNNYLIRRNVNSIILASKLEKTKVDKKILCIIQENKKSIKLFSYKKLIFNYKIEKSIKLGALMIKCNCFELILALINRRKNIHFIK